MTILQRMSRFDPSPWDYAMLVLAALVYAADRVARVVFAAIGFDYLEFQKRGQSQKRNHRDHWDDAGS